MTEVNPLMLLGEAISAVGQCTHILGEYITNDILSVLDAKRGELIEQQRSNQTKEACSDSEST